MSNLQSLADPPFRRKQKNLWFDSKADKRWTAYIVAARKREEARLILAGENTMKLTNDWRRKLFGGVKVWSCKLCGNKVPIESTAASRLSHLKHHHKKELWYKLDAFEHDWV